MARVLIVEDEAVLRSAMARGIAKLPGIAVVEAGTVQAAVEYLDTQPPQMIISDIDLPDRSGLELLGDHLPLEGGRHRDFDFQWRRPSGRLASGHGARHSGRAR